MNNILTISAGLKWSSLALKNGKGIQEDFFENDTPTFLVSNMKKFLEKNELEFKKLDGVIACSGPGSFTAIRTTLSIAKCLKIVLNIPVISVNIFNILEKKYLNKIQNKDVLVLLKSEMDREVYVKMISVGFHSEICALNLEDVDFDKKYDVIISDFLVNSEDKEAYYICDEKVRKATNFFLFEKELVSDETAYAINSFYVKPPYVTIQ